MIHRVFDAGAQTDGNGHEGLNQWESQGKTLERRAVAVAGRKVADRVIAIVQPVDGGSRVRRASQSRVP